MPSSCDKRTKRTYRILVFLCTVVSCLFHTICYSRSIQDRSPDLTYKIVNTFPHDPNAFTQGLIFKDGFLYESTGQYGESSLRKVDLKTGKILHIRHLPEQLFGEGITLYQDRIIQLTWRSRVGFVYDKDSFTLFRKFFYPTEGWGLTHDGKHLMMSDGSSTLYVLDPMTFQLKNRIDVHDGDRPVFRLNELEYIRGVIYANVWQTDRIARIEPSTGKVINWIDLRGVLKPEEAIKANVLNGIAYDAARNRIFITGKLWPKLFEIEFKAQVRHPSPE